jgi:phage tail protein X
VSVTYKARALEYKTIQGDIWDIVALRSYGDEHAMHFVQDANFYERFRDEFPASIILAIPAAVTVQNNLKARRNLPNLSQVLPWLSG